MPKKVAVIDGNSLMHRAYHAVPQTMNAPDGRPTNAAFGFLSMLLKFIDIAAPDALICAFDAGRPAFRTEAIKQYKAQRPPMDNDLKVQFPIIEELLAAMNIPVIRVEGWEGDDILGTIAARDEKLGYETLLVTGDKDAYQLAGKMTRIVTTKKGISDVAVYGPDEVRNRYGIMPVQVPDYLGLKGDPSDNIPGVPAIGEKTASKLLQSRGTLEGIYEHINELEGLTGKQKQNLIEHKDIAFASRKAATIVCDLDFPLDLEVCSFPSFDSKTVTQAFRSVRFNAHLNRVLKLVGEKPKHEVAPLAIEPIVRKSCAEQMLQAALERKEMVGVALAMPDQASLFSAGLYCAINTCDGTAIFEDEEGKMALVRLVREGAFAALDVKGVLHFIYPPDTAEKAYVNEADLMDMHAFDLSLAGYVLNSSVEEYTYDALLEAYYGGFLPETKDELGLVAARAAAARSLVEPLVDALENDGSRRAYFDIDLPLVGVLAIMERTGAAVDFDKLHTLGTTAQIELDDLRKRIIDMAGEEFNLDSPKQLAHILFEVLGLKPTKKNQRGYSTDAGVLKELAKVHEFPELVLHYRELSKVKSTYIDALPRMQAKDGRVHTSFNETVTATGRLSSSDPNLQNIPVRSEFGRQIRACFIPIEPGHKFLSVDYSQIELRLLAHLSKDEHLISAFCLGADFHGATASRVFGLPEQEITPSLRSRAKAVNFGIVYGQQAYGLSQSLDIPFGEAKEMIERYFEVYPGVRLFLDDIVAHAKESGYAQTMFGRKRHIPELSAKNANLRSFGERTAMNHPMQGSAADIIKLAMIEVQRCLLEEGLHAKLLLQVHDELDFSVATEEVEEVSALVKDIMEHVVKLRVPLVADVSFGDSWAESH